jgi:hypothetical protein
MMMMMMIEMMIVDAGVAMVDFDPSFLYISVGIAIYRFSFS